MFISPTGSGRGRSASQWFWAGARIMTRRRSLRARMRQCMCRAATVTGKIADQVLRMAPGQPNRTRMKNRPRVQVVELLHFRDICPIGGPGCRSRPPAPARRRRKASGRRRGACAIRYGSRARRFAVGDGPPLRHRDGGFRYRPDRCIRQTIHAGPHEGADPVDGLLETAGDCVVMQADIADTGGVQPAARSAISPPGPAEPGSYG